jgi:hypothetical protein
MKRSWLMTNAVAGFQQPEPPQRRGTMPSNGRLWSEATGLEANRDAVFQAFASSTHMQNAPRSARADAGMTVTERGRGKHGLSEE